MNGPFKRDVTRELADACREAGIGFFPYYSTCDWHHPDFPLTSPGGKVKRETSNLDRYTEYLEAQTKELITKSLQIGKNAPSKLTCTIFLCLMAIGGAVARTKEM